MLIQTPTKRLCKDCKTFIRKHKPWDESKVPPVVIASTAVCRKCRVSYTIYKGMVWGMSESKHKSVL